MANRSGRDMMQRPMQAFGGTPGTANAPVPANAGRLTSGNGGLTPTTLSAAASGIAGSNTPSLGPEKRPEMPPAPMGGGATGPGTSSPGIPRLSAE